MGIPYKRKGGVSFFEYHKEIKFLSRFYLLVVNPKDMMVIYSYGKMLKGLESSLSHIERGYSLSLFWRRKMG